MFSRDGQSVGPHRGWRVTRGPASGKAKPLLPFGQKVSICRSCGFRYRNSATARRAGMQRPEKKHSHLRLLPSDFRSVPLRGRTQARRRRAGDPRGRSPHRIASQGPGVGAPGELPAGTPQNFLGTFFFRAGLRLAQGGDNALRDPMKRMLQKHWRLPQNLSYQERACRFLPQDFLPLGRGGLGELSLWNCEALSFPPVIICRADKTTMHCSVRENPTFTILFYFH